MRKSRELDLNGMVEWDHETSFTDWLTYSLKEFYNRIRKDFNI